jgi:hypothetical protein
MPRGRPRKNSTVPTVPVPMPVSRLNKIYRIEMSIITINEPSNIWILIIAKTRHDKYVLTFGGNIGGQFRHHSTNKYDKIAAQAEVDAQARNGYRMIKDDVLNNNQLWFNKFVRLIKTHVTKLK